MLIHPSRITTGPNGSGGGGGGGSNRATRRRPSPWLLLALLPCLVALTTSWLGRAEAARAGRRTGRQFDGLDPPVVCGVSAHPLDPKGGNIDDQLEDWRRPAPDPDDDEAAETGNRPGPLRMTGGRQAKFGEAPWHALVLSESMDCAGVVIAPQVILTGAHCVLRDPNCTSRGLAKQVNVLLPHGDRASRGYLRQVPAQSWVAHERFRSAREADPNDIGLVRLAEPLKFALNEPAGGFGAVNRACLPAVNSSFAPDAGAELLEVANYQEDLRLISWRPQRVVDEGNGLLAVPMRPRRTAACTVYSGSGLYRWRKAATEGEIGGGPIGDPLEADDPINGSPKKRWQAELVGIVLPTNWRECKGEGPGLVAVRVADHLSWIRMQGRL